MSRHEKLLKRFLSDPKDFTYNELRTLLSGFGYDESTGGSASGSRVAFINKKSGHIIRLHRPHPHNVLKRYQIELIVEELKNNEVIK
jgi:hypothetical protein